MPVEITRAGGQIMALAILFTVFFIPQNAEAESMGTDFEEYSSLSGFLADTDWEAHNQAFGSLSTTFGNSGTKSLQEGATFSTDSIKYNWTTGTSTTGYISFNAYVPTTTGSSANNSSSWISGVEIGGQDIFLRTNGQVYVKDYADEWNFFDGSILSQGWNPILISWQEDEFTITINGNTKTHTSAYSDFVTPNIYLQFYEGSGGYIDDLYINTESIASESHSDYSVTDTYSFISSPTNGQYVDTTFNLTYNWNLPDATSSTTAYRITFLSQSGQDLSSYAIEATSTQQLLASVTETVTLPTTDDIVIARAYLYDSATIGSNLAHISSEYTFNVVVGGDPYSLDLGVFRTESDEFSACSSRFATSSFGYYFCAAGMALFMPTPGSLSYITDKVSDATSTSPFSYVYDVKTYIATLLSATSTSWEIVSPNVNTSFGTTTLLTKSQVEAIPAYTILHTSVRYALYLMLPFYVLRRTKSLFGHSDHVTIKT